MEKIGFLRKYLLVLLTKLQELTLKLDDREFYMLFTRLHFKLYYKKDLFKEFTKDSVKYKSAQERHGRMVASILHSESNSHLKIKQLAKESFSKDLSLQIKL